MDDPTLTQREPIDTIGAQLEAFSKAPGDTELFRELKRKLKSGDKKVELATLYELRAPQEKDALAQARMWVDAAQLRTELQQRDEAEADYRAALELQPGYEKASLALFQLLVEAQRYAEAADVADDECRIVEEALAQNDSAALKRRLAARYRSVARLWQEELGRLDKALQCWQRSFQLEPNKIEALEQSRAIYRSLGDEAMVVKLYEAELEIIGDSNRARRGEIELALGGLKRKRMDTQGAAQHLESALELNPGSLDAQESLAEVLATLDSEEEHKRASELFVKLGKRRLETEDQEGAISYLRRALGVDPYSRQGTDNLENVLVQARRWPELNRLYLSRIELAEDPQERAALLEKRSELCKEHLDDRKGHKECLRQLAGLYGPASTYAYELRKLCEEDGDGEELVELLTAEIGAKGEHSPEAVPLLLELATVYRDLIQDRDRSAEALHRILGIDPLNADALSRYADHFRERRDWRGLTDLSEYTIDQMREVGASPQELVQRLEGVAELCELRLGDIDRAIITWRRIEEIEGSSSKTNEALRRLMSRAKMWESLVGVLEQEAQQATTPQARAEALRRIAQVYRERQVNPRRAIALYEEVYGLFPEDDATLKALAELYEREGDDAGLAHTIRRQVDLEAGRMQASTSGRPSTARDWPVAKRVERLTALRRLAGMYETQLADVEGVVYACSGVLEILPGDRDALERMERVLEKAGDSVRLEQTLEYHVASSTTPVERSKLMRRLAKLAEERQDEMAAMERWEQVLKTTPNDSESLDALAGLYERHRRFPALAEVLTRSLQGAELPMPGSAEAAQLAAKLKTLATVLDTELVDPPRAIPAWRRVLEVSEKDRDALDALARLYEDGKQWRDLVEILGRQVPLNIRWDAPKAAAIALKRAALLEEHLGDPDLAAEALQELIDDVDPRNLEAHRRLRRLQEAQGNIEAAIRTAERELVLTEDPNAKISRGLEIGLLCRDRLGQPKRALQAFERVLELQPNHEEALTAASELYAKVGRWRDHIALMERRVEMLDDRRESSAQMLRIAHATAERLGDHRAAFGWYRRAHELAPDATTLAELRRAAETFGLWRELASVYEADRDKLKAGSQVTDAVAYVRLCRDIASIAENRLKDPTRALEAIMAALQVEPTSSSLLAEAERIAQEGNKSTLWPLLFACFELPLDSASAEERAVLYLRRAMLREKEARDPKAALDDLMAAFSWSHKRPDIRQALYDFGDRHPGHWNTILSIETALALRASSTREQIDILRRQAIALEERAKEPIRAFRTHISTFILEPGDDESLQHLWRLAREIGSYTGDQRTPAPEPDPARIEEHAALSSPPLPIRPSKPRREATEELSISDLVGVEDTMSEPTIDESDLSSRLSVGDSTQPIDLGELEEMSPKRRDQTMEVRTEDLIEALGSKASEPPLPPPFSTRRGRVTGPPPPPPRRPQIQKISKAPPKRAAAKNTVAKSGGTRRLPRSPQRAYSSPWSELAAVYQKLPAADEATALRWQFRAAEVWENGAQDVPRAFRLLSEVLMKRPDNPEVRERLFHLASAHGEWDRLAELYQRAADDANSANAAADLLMQVAEIRGLQNRPRETEGLYRRVLGMRPRDTKAREELEALYRREERWVDLAAQLEERTDPRLGSAAPIGERPALLRELAGIYTDRLKRPHDAIDALERLLEIEPENVELLSRVATLFEEIGRWSKVIQTLTRVADLADGQEQAKEAYRRIGTIYEQELELPDRAIVAFSSILSEWPQDTDAFEALDRLYQQHARWDELEAILRQRASMVRDQEERAQLLKRRATIMLEWLDSPDDAAAALRHARTIDPNDTELADLLVTALTRADRVREAASVIEGRIDKMRADGAADGDIAGLLIRLASLRAERLRDPIGAKSVLEEALELVPSHPTALATLARIAEGQQDPRAYAEARLREANAQEDVDAKIDAFMSAGHRLRELGDFDGARSAYEEVLALRPFHSEATWSLAGLVEQGGDVAEAIRLLGARLEAASLDPEERVQVLTQLAALSRQAGVDAAAEKRLEEALEAQPDYLPAIVGMADLLGEAERWQDLESFLSGVLPTLEGSDNATRAELKRRQAVAYEGLERSDEAYQTLIEADRLDRRNLLVKLALGQNRYAARRWREAALHLASLADHEEARRHPAEVAAGLYHAALAEIRSLRPEKAEALYQKALELKSNYAPALQALSEIAMERGNVQEATELMTRQATATDEPAERLRLFEALGDMVLEKLHDDERAKICYEAAVQAANPLENQHIPLLRKVLARQLASGDRKSAGKTCELLASFATDAQERCDRFVEAAQHYMDAEYPREARAAAERALGASSYDLSAADIASELCMAEGDYEAAAGLLGRVLNNRSDDDEGRYASDLALLWARLGEARAGRGDSKSAVSCYEKALDIAPDSRGAMNARRLLLANWGDDSERSAERVQYRQTLARYSRKLDDVVSYAKALCAANESDGGRAILELAAAMGYEYGDEEVSFLGKNAAKVMAEDEAYKGSLTQAEHEALIADAKDLPMAKVCAVLADNAALLWPKLSDAVELLGIEGIERVSATSKVRAAAVFTRIARALDAPATILYTTEDEEAADVQVVCTSPPAIVFGPRLSKSDEVSDLELRFLCGRAAELARPDRMVAAGLPTGDFVSLIHSVWRVFGPSSASSSEVGDEQHEGDEELRKALPVRSRAQLEELLGDLTHLSSADFIAACERAADRAGLLICGDIATALRHSSMDSKEHLMELPLREGYLACRAKLGVGVQK